MGGGNFSLGKIPDNKRPKIKKIGGRLYRIHHIGSTKKYANNVKWELIKGGYGARLRSKVSSVGIRYYYVWKEEKNLENP